MISGKSGLVSNETILDSAGVSLIELLTVICVIGILAAIAIPSWQSQIQKSRRSDATEALLTIAARQAQFIILQKRYADDGDLATQPPNGLGITGSAQQYYDLSLAAHTTGYLAIARPRANAGQIKDKQCQLFTLDATGARSAFDIAGNDYDNSLLDLVSADFKKTQLDDVCALERCCQKLLAPLRWK